MLYRAVLTACAAIVLMDLWNWCPAAVPVYGSPGYTPGVGGYIAAIGSVDLSNFHIEVNDAGTAVATSDRYNSSGDLVDRRALRWSASEAVELDHLGTSNGFATTFVLAINDAGVAAGVAHSGVGGEQPVRWNGPGTTATPLAVPICHTGSRILDINTSGEGVGIGFSMSTTNAVRWTAAGAPTVLPPLSEYFSTEVYALNDAGVAVRRAFNGPSGDRAVRWDAAGEITELGDLGLNSDGQSVVQSRTLNSAGTAVGYAFKHDESGAYQGTVPVRWEASAPDAIELETPVTQSGMQFGDARAINDSGVAVGYVQKPPSFPSDEFGGRAARWDGAGTTVSLLGTLGNAPNGEGLSDALGINSSGLIVGTSTRYNDGFSEFRAVYWRGATTPTDLNSLIDPASGWVLSHAYAVSDTGWIAGDGLFDPDGPGGQDPYGRHFLLQLPEPLAGDYNDDGHVNAADYVVWRNSFGSGASLPNDDTPGVGQDDYDRWVANFGQSAASGASASIRTQIPEPWTSVLFGIGLMCLSAMNMRCMADRQMANSSHR